MIIRSTGNNRRYCKQDNARYSKHIGVFQLYKLFPENEACSDKGERYVLLPLFAVYFTRPARHRRMRHDSLTG
jgi:hypothetical protein